MASSKANDTKNGKADAPAAKAAKSGKQAAKKKQGKNGKPGIIERARAYFAGVRTETRRVVWPTRDELVKYTAAVVGMLLFFGILIAIVDAAVIPALYAFSGLRG